MQEPTRPGSRKAEVGGIVRANKFHQTCGVLATACRQSGSCATREVPAVIAVWINWQLVRERLAVWDGGEARSTDEAG